MGVLQWLNEKRRETYFAANPLLAGDFVKDLLVTGPAALLDLGRKPDKAQEALVRETVGRDAPTYMERVDVCMAGLDDSRDYQMATLWLNDDLEIRILSYDMAVSIEDIPVSDIVAMISGTYEPEDKLRVEGPALRS